MTIGNRLGRAPRVTITVTQDVIDASIERDSSHCMIAEAIKKQLPNARFVSVDLQTIRWTNPEKAERYVFLTPRAVQIALIDFDQGRKPGPLSFTATQGHTTLGKPRSGAAKAKHADKLADYPKDVTKKRRIVREPVKGGRSPISGGKPPPVGPLAGGHLASTTPRGKRRTFGLRGLHY